MISIKQIFAFGGALFAAFSTQSNASEIWNCSMRAPLPNYSNTEYELSILDNRESAKVFWQKPGRFVYWAVTGSDLLETFRVSENSPSTLKATLDVPRSLHKEITLNKLKGEIKIEGGPTAGHIQHVEEGSCTSPRR